MLAVLPFPKASLHGIIPALITPLDADGRVDEASVHSLIEFQIQSGVQALFVLGSTGEGPLLSREEKLRAGAGNGRGVWRTAAGAGRASVTPVRPKAWSWVWRFKRLVPMAW